MLQIAYFSTAATPQDSITIHDILKTARRNNQRDQITGLLVAGGNRYLQVIEGPKAETEALYDAIRADKRHLAVSTLLCRSIYQRCFDNWAMAFRRDPKLDEVDSFPQIVRYLTDQVEDDRLKGQIRYFASSFITAPRPPGPDVWKLAG